MTGLSSWAQRHRRFIYVMSIHGLAVNSFFVGYRLQTGETGLLAFALIGVLGSLCGFLPSDNGQ